MPAHYTSAEDICQALKNNQIGVVPTDTILGLIAPFTAESRKKLSHLKNRDSKKPFLVLISNLDQLKDLTHPLFDWQKEKLETYWPGPVTVILKKSTGLSDELTSGYSTIGIRLPEPGFMSDILNRYGKPLYSTSLNESGTPALTNPEKIPVSLLEKIDFWYPKKTQETPSRIIDLTQNPPKTIR